MSAGSDRLLDFRRKVETVPMGLNLDPFVNPTPATLRRAAELRAQYGPNLWLSVGRCVYYKGFDTALRALRQVPGTLMIVGGRPMAVRSSADCPVDRRLRSGRLAKVRK